MTDPRNDFQQARADFRDAALKLLEPWETTTMQGYTVTMPPIVDHIAEGRTATPGDGTDGGGGYGSRPPIWVGGLDWQRDVIHAVARAGRFRAVPRHDNPRHALRWALTIGWGPMDADALRASAADLERLHGDALRLIWPEIFTLNAPCPCCGMTAAITSGRDGSRTRRPALIVREQFAECRACATVWWGAEIVTGLAAVLNEVAALDVDDGEDAGQLAA